MAYDAIVVGSGPNGLAAAVTLALAGRSVLVREAQSTIGGGTRSAELTLPGFRHDLCSAIHPLAAGSPFFRTLPLAEFGLEFVSSPAALAHPLDGGAAAMVAGSVDETAAGLGADGPRYRRLLEPFVDGWPQLADAVLQPLLRVPRHPVLLGRFGLRAIQPARRLGESFFQGEAARALLAGASAHSFLPLENLGSASFGLILLTLGHAVGWPFPRGGSQAIADALAGYLRSLGGEIEAGAEVTSLRELPPTGLILCDVTPRQLVALAGDALPSAYLQRLERWKYGPAVFKLDYALDGPMPWRDPAVAAAATVHVGGTLAEIAAAERAPWLGRHAERPFVLVAQQSLFDDTRAPPGKHTLWAYCHVPHGSNVDITHRVEAQLERFAPGFRDLILARSVRTPSDLEHGNANLIGGDISGGANTLGQLIARPTLHAPYATPLPGVFLCSSSTPPGGGVHGLCGHLAAKAALRYRPS